MMPILESGEETLVGGQAVMEGVMMRAPHSYCVAVRKHTGEIVTEEMALARMSEQYKIFRYPIFRGLGTLYQALKLGGRALRFSANAALDNPAYQKPGKPKPEPAKEAKEMPGWALAGPIVFSLAFFIFAYKFVPLWLVTKLSTVMPALEHRIAFNAVDGVIRLLILLGLLFFLSRTKDIRRVFAYHGAEHKVVFNFESGKPVNIENAQKFSTFHPRCGTSFLFVVIIVSIIFYTFIPFDGFLAKLLCRIALLPVITGVSYELTRFAAKRRVIDISGDGRTNDGPPAELVRDRLVQLGIVVNGLPVMMNRTNFGRPPDLTLDKYYEENVIGGAGSFMIVADNFDHFSRAVRTKLVREVSDIDPATGPKPA
jgi:uncharacterized protein YqhQ